MKRRIKNLGFTVAILLYFVLQANAQTDSNTMVSDHNSWTVLWHGSWPMWPYIQVGTDYIYFDGDSIVADYSYKKFFHARMNCAKILNIRD